MKENGLSGKKLVKSGEWITKEKNNNSKNTLKIFEILNKANFKYIAKFKDIDKNKYSYEFVDGETLEKVICMPLHSIIHIIDIIKNMHNLYRNSENQVIVHGDLSPVNVVFEKDHKIMKIIDWDGSYFGDEYEDIAYVCWLWVNFGDEKKEHDKYIENLVKVFKHLNYKVGEVKKIKETILNRIEKDQKNSRNNEVFEWYEYIKLWIVNNWGVIEDEFN
ncbi:aminoglycoside phosphotransferase family protein [Spiroplasma endosymbiont of Diplazon laetatorius]|uniref:aminoglycoside phosphotransferase family protein n=1 Tax=Spiroplasma endosymbiont of Diplazon laetatorius TaxID=3066322 RepID=UPI0030CEEA3D